MRFRLLVSFLVASMLVLVLVATTSTFVSALEQRPEPAPREAFVDRPVESSCDALRHEIHALSHAVSPCALPPECQGSPLLCPIARDARIQREYERLRDQLHEHCGLPRSLVDFAWETGEQVDGTERCGLVHDGFEAAVRGETRPKSYSF
jgi:hypothetical protein